MNKTLVISEDGMFANQPVSVEDVTQLACSAVVSVVGNVLSQIKENTPDEYEAAQNEMFDTCNAMFSHALEVAFPSLELRPDLTEEAILKAENELLKEQAGE